MAKIIERLSDTGIRRLKEPGYYHDGERLYFKISKWKTRAWVLRFKRGGRSREMGLGGYPGVGLGTARELAEKARALLQEGFDPIEKRHERKAEARKEQSEASAKAKRAPTFIEAAAACEAANRHKWTNKKHAYQFWQSLEFIAFPIMGKLPVDQITVEHVEAALKKDWQTKAETARRTRGRIEFVLDFAKAKKWRDGDNPARRDGDLQFLLGPQNHKGGHFNSLPYAEMPAFMAELRAVKTITSRALEFNILTVVRSANTRLARWDCIDLENAVWDPHNMKIDDVPHSTPLCARSLQILAEMAGLGNLLVFPGAKRGAPLSDMTMQKLLHSMRDGFHVHGFRATFKTWAEEKTEYPRELVERQMAHKFMGKAESAYSRGKVIDRRRKLVDDWCAFCMSGGSA